MIRIQITLFESNRKAVLFQGDRLSNPLRGAKQLRELGPKGEGGIITKQGGVAI
jgi:hypothetical protein